MQSGVLVFFGRNAAVHGHHPPSRPADADGARRPSLTSVGANCWLNCPSGDFMIGRVYSGMDMRVLSKFEDERENEDGDCLLLLCYEFKLSVANTMITEYFDIIRGKEKTKAR
ncbi:hypothetical protein EVAR_63178_1 [Eumeta japonica]|uniref:Uncharacterized protein n=1 Tax=Eumeta variegata TaxID=151549 RepID=A0A4C1Z485_EUMVA|nr:hypothetical protein EVAR_63178_1 [Eumeta japonica]